MKRHLTFELRSIHPDFNIKVSKDLEKRIGKALKLLGEIKVGKRLEMHFEDGFIFETSALDLQGYITKRNYEDVVEMVTLCTKDLAFELDVIQEKKIKVTTNEQLTLI